MATYKEIHELYSNSELLDRVQVAVVVTASAILAEATPSPERLVWAKAALNDPGSEGRRFLMFVLAANIGATVENIKTATDTAIQTNVDDAVTKFVGA
jgi:hypothetical protein